VKLDHLLANKESAMKLEIAELGAASKETRDYSGRFAWDSFVVDFRKHPPTY
jgi:hypothetical protein